ncbi:MAG: hypothetical protein L3J33_11380 [Rhodobacteraceae bacterium]|nr:hypothetical protein [Paracoccaceae bacterium]
METLQNTITPLFDEFQIQAAAKAVFETIKAVFETIKATVETALAIVAAAPFQSKKVKSGIEKITSRIADTAQLVVEYQFDLTKEIIEICKDELKVVEDEIRRLLGLKTEYDDLFKSMAQRLGDAQDSAFTSLESLVQDMSGMETRIFKLIDKIDYDAGLESLKTLGANLVEFEKSYLKIESDKALYEERLDALRPELLDASLGDFIELDLIQKAMAQIRARMDAAVLAHKYEPALIDLDALVVALAEYNAALLMAIAKQTYRAQLAEMEPRIYGASVSNYGPLETLSVEILTDHDKAVSLAASKGYAGASAVLDGLLPKLARYFNELPLNKQDEALYNGQITPVIERFNVLTSSEYPQLNVHKNDITALHDDLLAAAEQSDYPNAVSKLADLVASMANAELLLESLNIKRDFYDGEIDAVLARVTRMQDQKFVALETRFTEIITDRDAMVNAAAQMEYPLAADLMGALSIKLDAADVIVETQNQLQTRYESALVAIAEDLKAVVACAYPEMVNNRDAIIKLNDEMVEQAEQTYFAEAYENLQKATDLIEDFITEAAVLAEKTANDSDITDAERDRARDEIIQIDSQIGDIEVEMDTLEAALTTEKETET